MDAKRVIAIAAAELSSVGGIQTYIQNLAIGLQERGWDVHFIATNSRGDYFSKLSQTINCHDLSTLPLTRKKVFAAAELLKKIAPDILLMNHSPLLHYSLPLLSPSIKPVAVLHSHDPRFYRIGTSFGSRIFRWIAPTKKLMENCKRYLPASAHSRVRVIPHGINEKVFFMNMGSLNRASGSIIFVGSLGAHKGANILPEIFVRVLQRHPETQMTIVGKGPLRSYLETRFEELGLRQFIKFLGVVAAAELAEILRKADVLVLPTRIEGFGLVIVEAMLCGVIPVVSKLRGITDQIVENGKTGFLIEQNDIERFASAIDALLGNKDLIVQMRTEANDYALKQFSQKRMLDSYENLFSEEDDRTTVEQKNRFGWMGETLSEVIRRDVDGKLPLMHLLELIHRTTLRAVGRKA